MSPNASTLTGPARAVQRITTSKFAVNVIVYLFVGVFFFWVDFFGFEHAARFQMQDLVVQALADRQPRESPVAVVLWEDKDLAAVGLIKQERITWPLTYGAHAEALNKVLEFQPRSVFIDVLFKDERADSTFTELRATLRQYKKSRTAGNRRIHVYLANERGCGASGIRTDLLGDEEGALVTPVPVPIRGEDSFDSVIREYPTFANKEIEERTKLLWECTTAAVRMHVDAETSEYDLRDFRSPLVLRWGGCAESPRLSEGRRWLGVLFGNEQRLKRTCLPFDVIPARDLFAEAGSAKAKETKAKLEGKFVVYGTHLASAGDLVSTPVHDDLVPGLVVHAMALAELERWKGGYLRRPLAFKPFDLHWSGSVLALLLQISDLPLLLIGALAFALVGVVEHALTEWRTKIRGVAGGGVNIAKVFEWVLAIVIVLLPPFLVFSFLAFVLFQLWHISPVYIAPHIFVWILVENVTRIRKVLGAD